MAPHRMCKCTFSPCVVQIAYVQAKYSTSQSYCETTSQCYFMGVAVLKLSQPTPVKNLENIFQKLKHLQLKPSGNQKTKQTKVAL